MIKKVRLGIAYRKSAIDLYDLIRWKGFGQTGLSRGTYQGPRRKTRARGSKGR